MTDESFTVLRSQIRSTVSRKGNAAGSELPEQCEQYIHIESFVPVRVESLLDGSRCLGLLAIDSDYSEGMREGELATSTQSYSISMSMACIRSQLNNLRQGGHAAAGTWARLTTSRLASESAATTVILIVRVLYIDKQH